MMRHYSRKLVLIIFVCVCVCVYRMLQLVVSGMVVRAGFWTPHSIPAPPKPPATAVATATATPATSPAPWASRALLAATPPQAWTCTRATPPASLGSATLTLSSRTRASGASTTLDRRAPTFSPGQCWELLNTSKAKTQTSNSEESLHSSFDLTIFLWYCFWITIWTQVYSD